VVAFSAPSARAEYAIQSGDVVEISIAGVPEMRRRIMIDNDGKIAFPLLGEVEAAGLSSSELSHRLRDLLAAKRTFENPDVTVNMAEYRPIYVIGNVSKPGAYAYRPGMAVRDAMALAGGEERPASVDAYGARQQFSELSIRSLKLDVHAARLRSELGGASSINVSDLQRDGVETKLVLQLINMETEQLIIERDDQERERAYLTRVVGNAQEQLSALLAEQEQRQASLAQLQKDTERAQQLFQKIIDSDNACSGRATDNIEPGSTTFRIEGADRAGAQGS
jgi:polysaccharide biosynthesis/export protein